MSSACWTPRDGSAGPTFAVSWWGKPERAGQRATLHRNCGRGATGGNCRCAAPPERRTQSVMASIYEAWLLERDYSGDGLRAGRVNGNPAHRRAVAASFVLVERGREAVRSRIQARLPMSRNAGRATRWRSAIRRAIASRRGRYSCARE